MRFVAVGELLVDVIAEGSGHDAHICVAPGGSAFNAGIAASRAGAEVIVVGTVGGDAGGRMILRELAARGIETAVAVSEEHSTGTFMVVNGEIVVDRGVSRHAGWLPGTITGDAVLVSGYLSEAEDALLAARAPFVALDAARLERLPPGGNAVFANEAWEGRLDELAEGRRLAVVTLGGRGAIAMLDGRVERVEPERVAADAPGSGDVFAATLLVALARGDGLTDALSGATRAALDSLA